MIKTTLISFLTSSLLISAPVQADNWAHWRGPTGNGVARDSNPPTNWSETENVKWKVGIPGRGSGSPVVWENQVFVVSAVPAISEISKQAQRQSETGTDFVAQQPPSRQRGRLGRRGSGPLAKLQFKIFCFDRQSGDRIWEQTATTAIPHEGTHSTNSFASASPCTDGVHVYAHFGSRGLFCYTMNGELKWKREDFGKMKTRATFGEGSSPTLEGDKLLVPWDHEGPSHLMALNKLTGDTIWKIDRDEPSCWATPLVIEYGGKQQIIMNGQNYARAYDLETGKEIWRCGGQTQRPVASPVADNNLVFVGSGFQGSFIGAFSPDGTGDIEDSKSVKWVIERDTPDIASLLLSDGRLYFHKDKSGSLSCVDAATGKPHYTASRIPKLRRIYASPIAAGGHVYLTGRSGTTVVIKDSDELEIVAINSVGETVDATPAPVDHELFIRGEKHLFCIAATGR